MHKFTFAFNNDLEDKIVKFYPYRTARIVRWIIKIHLNDDDLWYLSKKLPLYGCELGNHIVFCTTLGAFWVSDRTMYIGTIDSVIEGAY